MTAVVQRSFSGGVLSPALQVRVDLARWHSGLKNCHNAFVDSDGALVNRSGFKYKAETKDGDESFIIDWHPEGTIPAYLLELGDGYIRFHKNGVPVEVSGVAAWSGATAYEQGQIVSLAGINYYAIQDGTNKNPATQTAYWHQLQGDILELPTDWDLDDLEEVQWEQNNDVMFFVFKDARPAKLTWTSETHWTLEYVPLDPVGSRVWGVPTFQPPTNVVNDGAAYVSGAYWGYVVTAVDSLTNEESLQSALTRTPDEPTTADPITISWTAVTNARGYNVFRLDSGGWGYLGFTPLNSFRDYGILPDKAVTPPTAREELQDLTEYFPAVVGSYQQRLLLGRFGGKENAARTNLKGVLGSKVALPTNFTEYFPRASDDSIKFQVTKAGEVRHFIDLGLLLLLTDTGEWIIKGDSNGVLRPGETNPDKYSGHGAAKNPRPLVVGDNALFVQSKGAMVIDLGFDVAAGGKDSYRSQNISAFAKHLFKGRTIVSWCFQKTPVPVVWLAMSDGEMLGLTYMREQQILAWHTHETQGEVKRLACVSEETKDAVYGVISRSIGGYERHFIEELSPRDFTDIRDAIFLDCSLTYDGRNTDEASTMELDEGDTWEAEERLTLISNAGVFDVDDVGNVIQLTGEDDDGEEITLNLEILEFTDAEHVVVRTDKDVPEEMQNVALSTWARAVDEVTGLDHLEGEEVAAVGDGGVIFNPNHEEDGSYTVEHGTVVLDKPYAVVHVGLPYITDIETLTIDTVNGETISNKKQLVNEVTLSLEETRAIAVGAEIPTGDDTLENMEEMVPQGVDYDGAGLVTGKVKVTVPASWNSNGHLALRNVHPLPLKINAMVPTGLIPLGG